MNGYYEKCFIIGSGQFAFRCAEYLKGRFRLDCIYEYGSYAQSRLEALCAKDNLPYVKLSDKSDCDRLMDSIVKGRRRTLIISASNIYIFPAFITECAHIRIINYHPALLSRHLGRNTEAWAIYEQDEAAGVTWHEVTSEIDHGLILSEDIIPLNKSITAIELMIKQYQMGFGLFRKFIGGIMENGNIFGHLTADYGKMHYSYERPNEGMLDLSWDGERISAFLRSMDYGNLNVMGRPFIMDSNQKYSWDSYEIAESVKSGMVRESDKVIYKDNLAFILRNIHKENHI